MAAAAILVVAVVGASAAPAATPTLSATLTAASSASVPQGEPFAFHASLASPQGFDDTVDLHVRPAGSGGPGMVFQRSQPTIAPGGSAQLDPVVTTSQWFAPLGQYEVFLTAGGAQIGQPLRFTVTAPPVRPAVFQDVTAKLGLQAYRDRQPCSEQASGAAWADVNGDGKLDLFVTRGSRPALLFVNRGARGFVDEAAARGVAGDGSPEYGAVFGDYDNDGHPDLYVTRHGTDVLYHNDGTGHFTDVTARAGAGAGNYAHFSASWGDFDGDGRLDLYVVTYGFCYDAAQPDVLLHNNGDGTFTDVSTLIQPDRTFTPGVEGRGFQAAWLDYNGDGRQDLYLANDHYLPGADGNRLWRNDGPGPDGTWRTWRFTDVSRDSGAGIAINSMGIGIGDYNRDGRLDLAVSNIAAARLLRNNPDGTFTNVAPAVGADLPYQEADAPSVTWGTIFGDFNLDGWEDLYFAAGYIESPHGAPERNELLLNARGRFLDLRTPSRTDLASWSRGVATADYDRDGRLDLLVVDQAQAVHLFRNVTPRGKNHWLEVNTIGSRSNRDGCGARIVATIKGASLVREVFCGSVGLSSGSDKVVHLGLGTAKKVLRLTVSWPSGLKQVLRNVKADRLLTVSEPHV